MSGRPATICYLFQLVVPYRHARHYLDSSDTELAPKHD